MAPTSICRQCDTEFTQPGIGRPRVFCTPECRIEHWNKRVTTGARSQDHVMRDIDSVTRLGTCSQCGPGVRAYKGSRTGGSARWRCGNRVRAQDSVRNPKPPKDPLRHKIGRWRSKGVDITAEQYTALLAEANGQCQICDKEVELLALDHCHKTGAVRGLLCTNCNTGLGKFGDDIESVQRIVAYLQHFLAREGALVN